MAKKDIIPPRESDLLLMHDRFLAGATAQGTGFGLTAADLAAITVDNEDLHTDITASVNADAAAQSATAIKKSTIKRVVASTRGYAQRVKSAPGYDEAVGDSMGIEGAQDTTDLTTAKPTLKLTDLDHGTIQIAFNKTISDGVNLYCQREGETASTFLARDTNSPYVDNRPLLVAGKPEVRRYRAKYVLDDAETGELSDEAIITAPP